MLEETLKIDVVSVSRGGGSRPRDGGVMGGRASVFGGLATGSLSIDGELYIQNNTPA